MADMRYIVHEALSSIASGLRPEGLHAEINMKYLDYANYHLDVSPALSSGWGHSDLRIVAQLQTLVRASMMLNVFRGVAKFAEQMVQEQRKRNARTRKAEQAAEVSPYTP